MLNKINALRNSVENENLVAINGISLVNGYSLVFNGIITEQIVENAKEEDFYDDFDIKWLEKDLVDQEENSDEIIRAAKKFAANNPHEGEWTKCGRQVKGDFDSSGRFTLEVIEGKVIKVA